MYYHISQNGVNIGKYGETDILNNLSNGTFTYADHYWAVGMPGWMPLSHFKPGSPAGAAVRPSSHQPAAQPARQSAGSRPSHAAGHAHAPSAATPSSNAQTFGLLGGGLMALGVFGPAAEMGKLGFSIIANGNTKGVILLALGGVGALLALVRQHVFTWIPAVIIALILGDMCIKLLDAPSATLFGTTIRLTPGWGLLAMLAGNALLFCAAWVGSNEKKP
jgi:hypothetical protein